MIWYNLGKEREKENEKNRAELERWKNGRHGICYPVIWNGL